MIITEAFSHHLITFLRQPDIQELLNAQEFKKLYNRLIKDCTKSDVCEFTELMLSNKLFTVDAFDVLPPYFLFGTQQTSFIVPENVIAISYGAFYNSALKTIKLPPGLKSIGNSTFKNCEHLIEIDLPNTLEIIDDNCFSYCSELKKIIIPDSVYDIPSSCFYGCEGLEHIILGKNISDIGTKAFAYCRSLKEIQIPGKVTRIGLGAFRSCDELEKVIIDEGVQYIGSEVFDYCSSLTEIHIPSTIYKLGMAWLPSDNRNIKVVYNGTQQEWDALHSDVKVYNLVCLK